MTHSEREAMREQLQVASDVLRDELRRATVYEALLVEVRDLLRRQPGIGSPDDARTRLLRRIEDALREHGGRIAG
jgi:hypothetical protein